MPRVVVRALTHVMLLLPLVMMMVSMVHRWVQQMRRYFDTKRDPKAKVKEPETRCSFP